MGTRKVYEERLRNGNLYHQPTINPGLGSARCPRCFSPLHHHQHNSKSSEWGITTVLHDATAVAGSGLGGLLTVIHGLNQGIPIVQKHVKGPMWLHFGIALPPVLVYSALGAAAGGYALPRFAQLSVTSYYAASTAAHYAISQATRRIEGLEPSLKSHDEIK